MSKKRINIDSLLHSKCNFKYHIIFIPKYRRMIIYRKIEIGKILRKLCKQKGVAII